jgi:PAS domain-containing protein
MKQPDNVNFIGTGFIRLDNGKLLYAVSTPIYNSVKSIAGFVIVGRVQTSTILKSLADNIGSCLTVVDYTDDVGSFMGVKGLTGTIPQPTTPTWNIDPNSPITAYDNSFSSNRTCAYNINGNVSPRTMGSILMTDARGKPVQVFRIDTDRTNLLIGIAGIFTTFGVLVIILILLSIVMVIFLDRVALRKVAKITTEIEQITVDSNMHARLSGDKKYPTDEFGVLIHCINKMLVSLEEASQRIQNVLSITLANEERARTIMNSINDYIVCVLTRDGTIAETNPAFADKFKFDLKASKGNTIVEKFIFELKLADLIQMSEQGEIKEGFFLTQFKEKIPVTIKVTATKIVVDDVPTEALVINAQNNAEQNSMMDKLKKMQDDLDFKEMWKTPRRRQAFKDFCVRERSVENVLFVEEVEVYRTIVNVAERYKKQMEILEKYLKPTGEFQVNISANVLQTEGTLIAEGYAQRRLFDKLEKVIMNMMSNDTYRRFKVLPPKEQGMGDEDTDTATTVSIRED